MQGEVTGELFFPHSENGYFFLDNLILLLPYEKERRKQCDIIQAGLKNQRKRGKKRYAFGWRFELML